jgi:hypothetical protein
MHGIIYTELQRFVEQSLGPGAWSKVLRAANLENHIYMSVSDYPDTEMFSIVNAASKLSQKSPDVTIEAFGVFIAPDLLRMYSVLIKREWKTLDVIEHTEAVIHTVVRKNQSGATPPELKHKRVGPHEIELRYDSARRLCRLARGIMKGIAHSYGEKIEIVEYECMHHGAPACVMHIRDADLVADR